jgi:hypothetical protein
VPIRIAPGGLASRCRREHELQDLRRDRGRPGHRRPDLVQAQQQPDLGQDLFIGPLVCLGQPGRHLACQRRVDIPEPDLERVLDGLPLGLVRLVGHQGFDAGLQLLPHPRHAAEDRGPDVGQCAEQRLGVGQRRDLLAGEHGPIVAAIALGDVRQRQVGDEPVARAGRQKGARRRELGHHLGVGDLHSLGRPGGARRVDQRQDIVGLHRPPAGLELEPRVAAGHHLLHCDRPGRLAVYAHHMLDRGAAGDLQQPRHELLLAQHHPVARVGQHLGDLLSREGVVHRERDRPQVKRRRVDQVELRPVGHHQGHCVPAARAKPGQPGRDLPDPAGVVPPGDHHRPAGRPQRQLMRVPSYRRLERLAHRRRDTHILHHGPLSRRRASNRDPATADGNHPDHLMKPP